MEDNKSENLNTYISGDGRYPNKKDSAMPSSDDIDKLRKKLEAFKKAILKKFKFTKALSLLPNQAFQMFEEEEIPQEFHEELKKSKHLHLLMIIPEEEYKNLAKIKLEVV